MFKKAYTFDDVLLVPRYSEILPRDVVLKTRLTKRIELKMPILSAAMDTVTEGRMAIAMALQGGMGIIHKNMTVEKQVAEVIKVKEFIVEKTEPVASTDSKNRLLAGAAVSTTEDRAERITALVSAGVDVLVVDTAHGHSKRVIDTVSWVKNEFPEVQVIAGNVATAEATVALIYAGADAVKVGIGPGSICTTRVVSGVGYPQLSAIMNCYSAAQDHDVPVIADGGIRYSGDVVKALAAGASAVMLGNMLAGTEETPGETFERNGEIVKLYRGMGSIGAMKAGSSDRYFQDGISVQKLVPEGVEATVTYRGPVEQIVFQLLGGLRSGMGYCGSANLENLREKAVFVEISNAGVVESHPHDVLQQ